MIEINTIVIISPTPVTYNLYNLGSNLVCFSSLVLNGGFIHDLVQVRKVLLDLRMQNYNIR